MNFDYSLLNGKIAEKYKTQRGFSRAIGISEHSISRKMNGIVAWKQEEMAQICQLLGIPASEIPLYFFSVKFNGVERGATQKRDRTQEG